MRLPTYTIGLTFLQTRQGGEFYFIRTMFVWILFLFAYSETLFAVYVRACGNYRWNWLRLKERVFGRKIYRGRKNLSTMLFDGYLSKCPILHIEKKKYNCVCVVVLWKPLSSFFLIWSGNSGDSKGVYCSLWGLTGEWKPGLYGFIMCVKHFFRVADYCTVFAGDERNENDLVFVAFG